MNAYLALKKIKESKNLKFKTIYNTMGISRQTFNHHLKKLKENTITFSADQILIIKKITGISILDFF